MASLSRYAPLSLLLPPLFLLLHYYYYYSISPWTFLQSLLHFFFFLQLHPTLTFLLLNTIICILLLELSDTSSSDSSKTSTISISTMTEAASISLSTSTVIEHDINIERLASNSSVTNVPAAPAVSPFGADIRIPNAEIIAERYNHSGEKAEDWAEKEGRRKEFEEEAVEMNESVEQRLLNDEDSKRKGRRIVDREFEEGVTTTTTIARSESASPQLQMSVDVDEEDILIIRRAASLDSSKKAKGTAIKAEKSKGKEVPYPQEEEELSSEDLKKKFDDFIARMRSGMNSASSS